MRFKQIKYVIFALICMCVTPLITHAECDYQRQAELSRLASNVQISYVYNDGGGFQVIMNNLTPDLYAVDMYNNVIYGGEEKTFNYTSGTVSFDIYATDTSCSTDRLLTKTVNLPTLNVFSTYDECKSYPGFKYCQVWGNFSISDEQFQAALDGYVQNMNSKLSDISEQTNTLQVIIDVLRNNSFMFIFFAVIILLTVIITCVRKRKK